ncbi:MAG TPA: CvpA family protein, partial [Sedimentibacter sp.]|nr:CvpA family protein [Sedimentibacter sp.]
MIIDVIILIFTGYLFFQGYRKGFILTVFDTLGMIISFFLSKRFYYIGEDFLLNNTKLFVKLHDYFEVKLSPSAFNNLSKIPVELQKFVNNIMASETSDTFAIFVDNLSLLIIRSISFIVTFLSIYAILLILS